MQNPAENVLQALRDAIEKRGPTKKKAGGKKR